MSRQPRKFSKIGLYHIIVRGINRQNIFEESEDFNKFKDVLIETKDLMSFKIYAYCLMSNHLHLFIKEKEIGNITKIMHRVLTKYVGWYNWKYQRSGSLIGNRFKSESVEDERYYFALIRYIHQNPIKAGISAQMGEYEWSSYNEYIMDMNEKITDTSFLMNLLSNNEKESKEIFIQLHKELETEEFNLNDGRRMTDEQVRRRIIAIINGEEPYTIGGWARKERNEMLCQLRQREKFTIGQLERVTGISRGIITRANVQKLARPQ